MTPMADSTMDNKTLSREVILAKLKDSAGQAKAVFPPSPHLNCAKAKIAILRKKKSGAAEGSPTYKRFSGSAPVVFLKRLLRLPIFWYVNPIAKQQADVNSLQYEILCGLCGTIDGLREEVDELKRQVQRLQDRRDAR